METHPFAKISEVVAARAVAIASRTSLKAVLLQQHRESGKNCFFQSKFFRNMLNG
jgi:hypothetical protein